MKKILIFGVSGNMGGYLVDYFLNQKRDDIELIGIDLFASNYVKKTIPFISLDINNREGFARLPQKDVYAVIDLVGPMPGRMVGYHPEEYVDVNVRGSFNVFQYAVEVHADRILYAKSFCDILKRAEDDIVLKVDTVPLFDYGDYHAVYSVTQTAAAELLKCIHAFYGIRSFIFRLPHIYLWTKNEEYSVKGVRKKMMHRIMIDHATNGEPVEVWGDATRKKDMVYVKDMCQVFYKATFVDRQEGVYNVGTGVGTTLLDQVKGMIQVFDEQKTSKIVLCPEKPDAPQYIMDIKETVEELGYEPQYGYLEMLEDMKMERKLNRF